MLGILKSQPEGYFGNCQVCIYNPVFGKFYQFGYDILLSGLPGFFFDKVAEIIGRKENFIC